MNKLTSIAVATTALALPLLGGGPAMATPGPSGTWPSAYPLPTNPGTMTTQTDTTATVRSTDEAWVVEHKLDWLYATELGCTRRIAMGKPRDYFCYNPTTNKVDEIVFTFAALDPTTSDPTRAQTNAYYLAG